MVCNASRVCVCEDGFILSVSGVYCNRMATGIYVALCAAQYRHHDNIILTHLITIKIFVPTDIVLLKEEVLPNSLKK